MSIGYWQFNLWENSQMTINNTEYCNSNTSGLRKIQHLDTVASGPSWSWSRGIWIYSYLCNHYLSTITMWVWILLRRGVLDTTLCDKVCQWLAANRLFFRVLRFPPSIQLISNTSGENTKSIASTLNTTLVLPCFLKFCEIKFVSPNILNLSTT